MRRCPSFSTRPGFPKGLQVLVLDPELAAGVEAEVQLKDCGYSPVTCCSVPEALLHLTNPNCAFDLLLVDVMCLATKSPENTALLAAAKTLPLVLMSSCCSPGDIMIGIKQGAVDFLEKPLHTHRLRNIWQHVVRKMMNPHGPTPLIVSPATGCGDSLAPLTSSVGGSVANSAGGVGPEDSAGAGESGSNESTSERAPLPLNHPHSTMELDLETSSLLDAVDAALGNPLAGLTSGFSHLMSDHHIPPAPTGGAAPILSNGSCNGSSGAAWRPAAGRCSADLTRAGSALPTTNKPERKQRSSAPGNTFSSSGGDSKPVMGYPAGQLPAVSPGMEWGLPTNPIQISPKFGPTMPAMPWMPPMMPPPMMMHPSLMGPNGAAPMMLPGMMPPAAAAAAAQVKAAAPQPAAAAAPCKSAVPILSDVLSALDSGKPPIGLQLKKSSSLMDLINESLSKHTVTAAPYDCSLR